MSSLIDRQVAIDALELQAKEMSRWVERYTEQAKGILTAKRIVEVLPTVEAIPIDWIEKHYLKADPSLYTKEDCIIENMLIDWKGEK